MAPRIQHSEHALVMRVPDPSLHTLVVAKRPDGICYIKALRAGAPPVPYELHPLNERYAPITDVRGWSFVGAVTAILKAPTPREPNIEWSYGSPLRA